MKREVERKQSALKDDLSGGSECAVSSINQCLNMRWDIMRRSGSMTTEQRRTSLGGRSMTTDEVVATAQTE